MKNSTIPAEFQDLWLERGVKWNEEKTQGHLARDSRLNGPMLMPTYPSFLGEENSTLLDHLNMPILRINGEESNPFGGIDWNYQPLKIFDSAGVERFRKEISNKENVNPNR